MIGDPPPTVSVVIPAYNAARWIAETLESVLAQTFRDIEIIVVDDGSRDQTPEVVARYSPPVRYLRKENGGIASARNAGIRAARGSYVAFVDADDLWLPEKLQVQMELLLRRPDLAWVYSDAVVFEGETGQELYKMSNVAKLRTGDILRPLFLGDFIPSPTLVIRREVFEDVGNFHETPDFQMGEDWNLWMRIAAKYPVGLVERPLARHRLHAASNTPRIDPRDRFRGLLFIIEDALAQNPERLSDLRKRALANLYVGIAGWMLKRGDRLGAREMFARAISLRPWDIRPLGYWSATWFPQPILNSLIRMRRFLRYDVTRGLGQGSG